MLDPAATTDTDLMSCAGTIPADDVLLEALRRGDTRAFEVTFQAYKGLVYNLSYRILLDREDALDVSQEVFLTLFRKIHTFRGDASLKSWLFRVTYNRSLNKRRWWRRRGQSMTEPLTELHLDRLPAETSGPDTICLEGEMDALFKRAMSRLPLVQRGALMLRDLQGCSYEEIAKLTGVSIGTVKSRIARARTGIQRDLAMRMSGEDR
jgi:RNA polymerase sigma-70 factor (ECF subfamily)